MASYLFRSASVLVALAAYIPLAHAESDRTFPQGRATCHARVYDAAHLGRHPAQRVVAISFARVARDLAAEKQFIADGEMTEDMISAADGALHFAIADGRALRIAGGCTNHRDLRALGTQTGDRVFTLPPRPMDGCR
jgi:hypothetical protein